MPPLKAILTLALTAGLLIACVPLPSVPGGSNGPAPSPLPITEAPRQVAPVIVTSATHGPASECPGVDSALVQMLASPDPVALAKQMAIKMKDGDKIQVVLALSQPDIAPLAPYGVEIGSQSGNDVQAYVPIGKLCELAKSGQVLAINLPSQAVTQ